MNEHPFEQVVEDMAPEMAGEVQAAAAMAASSEPPVPDQTGSSDDGRRLNYQKWCLLDQLLQATPHHRLSKGEANRKLTATLQRELQLTPATANQLRESLAREQYLHIHKKGRSLTYELTDAGREHLQRLDPYPPPPAPVAPEIQRYQIAHLLFQLFKTDGRTLARGEANKNRGPKELELSAPAANELRKTLARQGAIEILRGSRSESYRLTPEGEALLGTLQQYPESTFNLKGKHLNALLGLAVSAARQQDTSAPRSESAAAPADLSQAVYAAFEELRRESYSHTRLVPIHEIRRKIAENYGPQTARHDVLDEPIRELWRQGRVRMVALADLQRATPEQLNDSVPGVNETLFYLESAHEQPVL